MGSLSIILGTPLLDDLRYLQTANLLSEIAAAGGYAQAAARAMLGLPVIALRFDPITQRPQLPLPDGTWRAIWIDTTIGVNRLAIDDAATDEGSILPTALAHLCFDSDGWPQLANFDGSAWYPLAVIGAEGALELEISDPDAKGNTDMGAKLRVKSLTGEVQMAHKTAGTFHTITLALTGPGPSPVLSIGPGEI